MCRDFEELLAEFNAANVRYLIGGAHALALHARPRATKDLDLFVWPTRLNARRCLRALSVFFGGKVPSYVDETALLDPDTIIQLGVAPVRVDLLSHFATRTFAQAWRERVSATFGAVPASYLSVDHLIAEKSHFDRPQDRADVAALRKVRSLGARAPSKALPSAKPVAKARKSSPRRSEPTRKARKGPVRRPPRR